MSKHHKILYEHQPLKLGEGLEAGQLKALQGFYGSGGVPYFSLINNGVKFCEYVGVIQVGNLVVEVLPKADRREDLPGEKAKWQSILIGMLKAVGVFDVKAPSSSHLTIKTNSILDLYFNLFINEVEYLLRLGLIRQYRKIEGNRTALKGRLVFSRQIRENLVHQERFYTRYTAYDNEHLWHIILHKAIRLIKILTSNAEIQSRIGALELYFPCMPDLAVTKQSFEKLRYSRKTECYRPAIEIARLLLLNYHPDVRKGKNSVLALMFDMNTLWELFVYASLRRKFARLEGISVQKQSSRLFWEDGENRHTVRLRPDLLIRDRQNGIDIVWDTKWKVPGDLTPSAGDLQQLFAYSRLFGARFVALVYPGPTRQSLTGSYHASLSPFGGTSNCGVITIPPNQNIQEWQEEIYHSFEKWEQEQLDGEELEEGLA
ncbi:MAG: McrC family protein [Candidatus Syntrophosphaera sp.]